MLPVEEVLPDLRAALTRREAAVLVAPPGAGKTTRVPPALLGEPWTQSGKIILLSPRRIAARAAAARMAQERGERVGDTIGYRVRLDSRVGPKTSIEVVTEGVFTRMILDDPELKGVAAVLFDEFHERSLEGDLGLALARDAQAALRPDLKLVVMSATLDAARIAALLDDAPVIVSEGRMFPVAHVYRPRDPRARLEQEVSAAVRAALAAERGSALVFLPGVREIERAAEALRAELRDPIVDVRPLYGAMSAADQDAAIAPAPAGRRKVVLATSIAETSLTIDGVRIVVDAGLARRPRYEPALGLSRLETVRASLAAITQRAGRAGRLEPGVCWRLWSEGETRALPAFDRPDILDADLAGLALDLAAWGVSDPAALAWLDPPPKPAWTEALALLKRIGALDNDGRLTPHGEAVSRLPLPPRLAHMVIAAATQGQALLAARIAVLLTEQGLGGRDADLRNRLHRFHTERGQRADAARKLAARVASRAGGGENEALDEERAGAVLALAFPDRVAKARGGGFVMVNGRAAAVDEASALAREPYLAIADIAGSAGRAQVLLAAPIALSDIEAMFGAEIETRAAVNVDTSGAVRGRRTRRLGRVVLSDAPLEKLSADEMKSALLDAVRDGGLALLDWNESARQTRARVALMRSLEGEEWPDWSDAMLQDSVDDWLAPAMASHLRDVPVSQALLNALSYDQRRRLDAEAPPRFETAAGSSLLIDYEAEGGPAVDVRLQELFGVDRHPNVANGRVALTLRLLSPAHRPVQTTKDLPGFWRGSYASVRSEMRGRYPKHPWPDDPLSGAADAPRQTKRLLMIPTIDDVKAAAERIKGIAIRTPLLRNDALDTALNAKVWVKAENLQRGGAFKMRGASNAISALSPEVRARGVIAFSSGNHAIAVSTVAKLFAIPATIVMPADSPAIKLETVRGLGADLVTYDRVNESREAIGARLLAEKGGSLIKPFDDPFVIAGQGTAGLEIADELAPDVVFVPASGGGLSTGVALALPNARIIAVEPQGHDDIARSLAAGSIQKNAPGIRSICDGLLTDQMGEIPFEIARERFERVLAVSDQQVLRAMKFAFRHLKLVLEPSGAATLAAALEGGVDLKGQTVALIASGGNVDGETFARALAA